MNPQVLDIITDRLLQARGVLAAIQASDERDGIQLDPCTLSAALSAVQELLQQAQGAVEVLGGKP